MAVRILRRVKAAQDAEEIADYIAKDSLDGALRFLENMEATLKHLAKFPNIGGPFASDQKSLENLRTWRVSGFPNHVIFYIEHYDAIEIVRILHGACDADSELRTN